KFLASHDVQPHRTSKQELDSLRALVARDLADACVLALSADRRFKKGTVIGAIAGRAGGTIYDRKTASPRSDASLVRLPHHLRALRAELADAQLDRIARLQVDRRLARVADAGRRARADHVA